MHVYFIEALGQPPMVKVGKAGSPISRMAELQVGCPYDLVLLAAIRCNGDRHSLEVEQFAHRTLHKFHKRGEWFYLTPAIREAIKALAAGEQADFRKALQAAHERRRSARRARERFEGDALHGAMDREFRSIIG